MIVLFAFYFCFYDKIIIQNNKIQRNIYVNNVKNER